MCMITYIITVCACLWWWRGRHACRCVWVWVSVRNVQCMRLFVCAWIVIQKTRIILKINKRDSNPRLDYIHPNDAPKTPPIQKKTSSWNRKKIKESSSSTRKKNDQLNTPGRAKEGLNSKTRPHPHEFCQSAAVLTICCVNTLEPKKTALNRHLPPLPQMELLSTTTRDSLSISTSSTHPLVSRFENFSKKASKFPQSLEHSLAFTVAI